MEFKFRSIHERYSTYFTPPANLHSPSHFSYFTHPAIRAGMANPDLGHWEFHRNPSPNPNEFREAMQFQRELEKERIRAEIITEEIMSRRVLEEEVRREMMMEREMAMRFGYAEPMRFGYAEPMRFEPRVPPLLTNFEHRERLGLGDIGVSPYRETGFRGFETRPFQRDPVASASGAGNGTPSNVTSQEVKGGPALEVAKDKIIILAKPTVTAADLKRKAPTQPNGSTAELSGGSKKQKTKDDWSCALCRVSATSERGLNEHLQGKKHKARERGLLTQRTVFGTPQLPKKTIHKKRKRIKTPGKESSPTPKNKDEKAEGGTGRNLAQKKESSEEKQQNRESAVPQKRPGSAKPKKKLRFLCEVCKVGAHSQKVMDAHMKGKRHLATLLELNQTGETKTINPGKTSTENVATDATKQESVGELVKIKEANVNNNPATTDDKDKKSSEAVCSDALVVEDENKRLIANGTDS